MKHFEYDNGPIEDRVQHALQIAFSSGGYDGAHHKMHCIDQMVRALTGCPIVTKTPRSGDYTYDGLGESEEYLAWVKKFNTGDDGEEDAYEWETGSPA
jgi:hypothetical protein